MSKLIAVLLVILAVPMVHASDLAVSITPEYGTGSFAIEHYDYPADHGVVSSRTDFKMVHTGLTTVVRFGIVGAMASVRYATMESTGYHVDDGREVHTPEGIDAIVGKNVSADLVARVYLSDWLYLDAGGQYTRTDGHSNHHFLDIQFQEDGGIWFGLAPGTSSFRSISYGPAVGGGIGHEFYGRVTVRAVGAWYPHLKKRQTYGFSYNGVTDPVRHGDSDGSGFSVRASMSIELGRGIGLTGGYHYRRISDEGHEMFDEVAIPQHWTSQGASVGLTFRP